MRRCRAVESIAGLGLWVNGDLFEGCLALKEPLKVLGTLIIFAHLSSSFQIQIE